MPHLTIEYSANVGDRVDIDGLCGDIHAAIHASGLFELGAIRVRSFAATHFAIADRLAENGFVDLQFRIGAGRSPEEKKRVGEAIFAAASAHLATLFESPHFALSLEIREIDPDLSWKKNAIDRKSVV
jgi:5-carboxymethyl-2-hydroxymuconate isomerase